MAMTNMGMVSRCLRGAGFSTVADFRVGGGKRGFYRTVAVRQRTG